MNKIALKMRQVCIRCFFRKVGGVDVVVLQKMFRQPISQNGFTLLELLVAMAVFSMMTVLMLSMTNSLIGNVSRIDDNTEVERSVRVFFDLLRRDLAQSRIGLSQNVFRGETNRICFASSSPRLNTNHVSDVRLIVYEMNAADQTIRRAVVEPTMSNHSSGAWNPTNAAWWNSSAFSDTNFSEIILEGVQVYTNQGQSAPPFSYVQRNTGALLSAPTATTNPPAGVVVAFGIVTKKAIARGVTNAQSTKSFRYDIELNLPPVFDP
jgi:prepilin-type N-terminal cleavage/methylation domain-containing protein